MPAYVEVQPAENNGSAMVLLRRAVTFYRARGTDVLAVMADNGSPHRSISSARAYRELSLRTLPYRPRTNGRQSGSFA